MFPKVSIGFDNGALGTVVPSSDGVFGLLASATAVTGEKEFLLDTPYQLKGMAGVASLGITEENNHRLYKTLKEFYSEAGEGTELWLMGLNKGTSLPKWFDGFASPAAQLLDKAKGNLSAIFTSYSGPVGDVEEGLSEYVWATAVNAQELAKNYTDKKYAPFITLLEGYGYDGGLLGLREINQLSFDRVGIMIGDTQTSSANSENKGSAIGVLAGRLAKNQVHVNIGKVKDGPLKAQKAYILDTPVELYDVEELSDKGYITLRTHQGKSGYFFVDDPLACVEEDDYHYISRRRVIDKAYRLTYKTLVNYILDEVTLSSQGTINPIYAKKMEGDIVKALYNSMTANGELSSGDDQGVSCYIDPNQDVAATSTVNVTVKVRPHGYNRWIEVKLGFNTKNN